MFASILSFLSSVLDRVLAVVLVLLPKSPFVYIQMIPDVEKILGYVNYFVPIQSCLVIAEAWLSAVAVWYIYQAILRWVKIVS